MKKYKSKSKSKVGLKEADLSQSGNSKYISERVRTARNKSDATNIKAAKKKYSFEKAFRRAQARANGNG